jgi:hypothetical protein
MDTGTETESNRNGETHGKGKGKGGEIMKVYLAARYSRNDEMRGVRDVLQALGYEITSRWIEDLGGKYGQGSFTAEQLNGDPEYCERVARRDLEDIENADTVISFTSAENGGKGGRHVEYGLALGLGKRLVIVGPRENVFHTLPAVEWYPDWPRLVMAWSRVSATASR